MNEAEFWRKLQDKWPNMHWVRIENSTSSGIPDTNMCVNGVEIWAELKILRGDHIYLEKFQAQFHIRRNMYGGRSLIFAGDKDRFIILKLKNPKTLERGKEIGKFLKFSIHDLGLILQWNKPFKWDDMFDEFLEKVRDGI